MKISEVIRLLQKYSEHQGPNIEVRFAENEKAPLHEVKRIIHLQSCLIPHGGWVVLLAGEKEE